MKRPSGTKAADDGAMGIKFQAFGPTPEAIAALGQAVLKQKALQARLAKTRNRLLRIELVEPSEETKPARPKPPKQFRAIIYDYTNNVALSANWLGVSSSIAACCGWLEVEVPADGKQRR